MFLDVIVMRHSVYLPLAAGRAGIFGYFLLEGARKVFSVQGDGPSGGVEYDFLQELFPIRQN